MACPAASCDRGDHRERSRARPRARGLLQVLGIIFAEVEERTLHGVIAQRKPTLTST